MFHRFQKGAPCASTPAPPPPAGMATPASRHRRACVPQTCSAVELPRRLHPTAVLRTNRKPIGDGRCLGRARHRGESRERLGRSYARVPASRPPVCYWSPYLLTAIRSDANSPATSVSHAETPSADEGRSNASSKGGGGADPFLKIPFQILAGR